MSPRNRIFAWVGGAVCALALAAPASAQTYAIQGGTIHTPAISARAGLTQRHDLRVTCGIRVLFPPVSPHPGHSPVLHHHCAHGHITTGGRFAGQSQGIAHEHTIGVSDRHPGTIPRETVANLALLDRLWRRADASDAIMSEFAYQEMLPLGAFPGTRTRT